ncbi:hypothetical protein E2C01_008976 [Portunus trituberculatus]|uniref:Uncharacterized protein n=1 Tax=Portunus trituberculatus TaxID=210409 RepID=A0A5B7D581_PORTR|nr:hypothetical protein [Portunus trituberculatus]
MGEDMLPPIAASRADGDKTHRWCGPLKATSQQLQCNAAQSNSDQHTPTTRQHKPSQSFPTHRNRKQLNSSQSNPF